MATSKYTFRLYIMGKTKNQHVKYICLNAVLIIQKTNRQKVLRGATTFGKFFRKPFFRKSLISHDATREDLGMAVKRMTVTTQLIHPENIHRLLYIHTRNVFNGHKVLIHRSTYSEIKWLWKQPLWVIESFNQPICSKHWFIQKWNEWQVSHRIICWNRMTIAVSYSCILWMLQSKTGFVTVPIQRLL